MSHEEAMTSGNLPDGQIDRMLNLQEVLASQNNLEQLCADRPLKTKEVFAPNAYYGISTILKDYAGLPKSYSLKAIMPHGIVFDEDYVWRSERVAHLPVLFCYPPYRRDTYVRQMSKRIALSASPFLYLVEMLKDLPKPDRQGTIFFPHHSTHRVTAMVDFERLAQQVASLGDEYKPITTCLYWRDFNLGRHIPFQKRGMRIVSAGHIYDPNFLYRLYHLCSIHRFAAGNGLGSHIFYAVKAGCSYFHLEGSEVADKATDPVVQHDISRTPAAKESMLKSLFGRPVPHVTAEQLKVVDYYLGCEYLKSPRSLRRQLLYAEVLDKIGFLVRNGSDTARLVIPGFYRRGGRSLKRVLLTTGSRLLRRGGES
jgi:hypothetical protein